jgi:peptide/nickel transport system substrate-binding protein
MKYNPDHWKWSGPNSFRDEPSIKTVIWLSVQEDASRLMMLQSGDVDLAHQLSDDQIFNLQDTEGYELVSDNKATYRALNMMMLPEYNGEPNPLADNRVRLAIKYAINYEDIANELFRGFATIHQSIIPPNMPGYMEYNPYTRDIDKAKELMNEAGYPDGIDLELFVRPNDVRIALVQKLQADLLDANIRIAITQVGHAEWRAIRHERRFQLNDIGFSLDYFDPDAAMVPFAYCKTLGEDDPVQLMAWRAGWLTPEYADMMDEARTMANFDERKAIYDEIQKAYVEEGPIAGIIVKSGFLVIRDWVKGLDPNPTWFYDAENMSKEAVSIN